MNKRWFLLAAVFFGGVATLGIQLSSSRLLAPYFGTSQLIWANVIGLSLINLTIGYQLGGQLVDRRPDQRVLGMLMIIAGAMTALIPLLAQPILGWAASAFGNSATSVLIGSFIGVLVLFSPPLILMGMASPFCIRLAMSDVASSGTTAGSVYGLSTLGSIIGTFLPVLLLIPSIGTRSTFLVFAVMLIITGLFGLRRQTAGVGSR